MRWLRPFVRWRRHRGPSVRSLAQARRRWRGKGARLSRNDQLLPKRLIVLAALRKGVHLIDEPIPEVEGIRRIPDLSGRMLDPALRFRSKGSLANRIHRCH